MYNASSPLPSLEAYLACPCGILSIPYYKAKSLTMPPGLRVIHHRSFHPEDWNGWHNTPYFRLRHNLRQLPALLPPAGYTLAAAEDADCPALAELIGRCYGFRMEESEVRSWRCRQVFRPELWLLARDSSGSLAGAAIAEFDPDAAEGSLEWIQVHPDHRRRGLGAALVSALLERLAVMADFATVSGEVHNPTAPESLYRQCGFTGSDVWHILQHQTNPPK